MAGVSRPPQCRGPVGRQVHPRILFGVDSPKWGLPHHTLSGTLRVGVVPKPIPPQRFTRATPPTWRPVSRTPLSLQREIAGCLGLQPARSDRPRQRARAPHGLVARHDRRVPAGHPAGARRGHVHAEPERRHPGHRRRLGWTSSGSMFGRSPEDVGDHIFPGSCRRTTGTSRSTARSSSTPASTTISSRSTPPRGGWPGRPRSLVEGRRATGSVDSFGVRGRDASSNAVRTSLGDPRACG